MHSKVDIQKGKILLAEPFMLDPGFKRSAVLLCDHGVEGSVGFILNKPLDMDVSSLLKDFPDFDMGVYYGGPVATDTLHYLHNMGSILDESIEVAHGIYWGGNFAQLKVLLREGLGEQYLIKFYVGYSGWSSGQLVDELDYGSWLPAELDPNYLSLADPLQLWKQIMADKGANYQVIAEMPDDVHWN